MPCFHRFQEDLTPQHELRYLFVGTFNPEWNNPNGNNANWFYGRRTNSFWRILPSVFGGENMNTIQHRENPQIWKNYCTDNGIGITDIITTILDAEEEEHGQQILGFQDEFLEQFNEVLFTNIPEIIHNNSNTLLGVYLTRYSHTLNPNGIFHQKWHQIEGLCNELGIHNSPLVTPSNGYMMPVAEKSLIWQQTINFQEI